MGCPACVGRLRTALSRLGGVISAQADHRSGRVRVRFDEGRVSEDDLRERIRTAGYEVTER